MNTKGLVVLGIAALVLAAGAAVVVSRGGAEKSATAGGVAGGKGELLLPKAREQMGKIAKVRLKRGAVETVLESKEVQGKPAWVVASKHGYPAESERVRKLIGEVLEATIVEPKTAKPELYERIGVGDIDKPGAGGALVELADAKGEVLGGVIVGNASQAGGSEDPLARPRYFVRRAGEAQSYLASGGLMVAAEPMSWVTRSPFELELPRVQSASITRKGAAAEPGSAPAADQVLTVSKPLPEDPSWKLENIPEGRALKDEYAPARVAQALSGIAIDDVAPAASVDMEAPDVVVEARTFDGLSVRAIGVLKEGKRWWAFSASFTEPAEPAGDDATKAARERAKATADEINKRHGGWVYILPEYKNTALMATWEDLLKPVEPAAPTAAQPPTAPLPDAQTPPVPPGRPAPGPAPAPAEPAPAEPRPGTP